MKLNHKSLSLQYDVRTSTEFISSSIPIIPRVAVAIDFKRSQNRQSRFIIPNKTEMNRK